MSLPCPVAGCCGEREQPYHVTCRDCWTRVPVYLRTKVWGCWGQVTKARAGGIPDEIDRAVAAHAAASRRAIVYAELRAAA